MTKNAYRIAATEWAKRKGAPTLRFWLRTWTFETALPPVRYGNPLNPSGRSEDAAMWLWYMAARKAGDRLTINADWMPSDIDIQDWMRAACIVAGGGLIHPDVYAISAPYQLVIV